MLLKCKQNYSMDKLGKAVFIEPVTPSSRYNSYGGYIKIRRRRRFRQGLSYKRGCPSRSSRYRARRREEAGVPGGRFCRLWPQPRARHMRRCRRRVFRRCQRSHTRIFSVSLSMTSTNSMLARSGKIGWFSSGGPSEAANQAMKPRRQRSQRAGCPCRHTSCYTCAHRR